MSKITVGRARQVPLRRELARACGPAGTDVVDGLFRRSFRDVGGHGDEIFHRLLLRQRHAVALWKWNHCRFGKEFQLSRTGIGVTVRIGFGLLVGVVQ